MFVDLHALDRASRGSTGLSSTAFVLSFVLFVSFARFALDAVGASQLDTRLSLNQARSHSISASTPFATWPVQQMRHCR